MLAIRVNEGVCTVRLTSLNSNILVTCCVVGKLGDINESLSAVVRIGPFYMGWRS